MVPDKHGRLANVMAGYDDINSYLTDTYYMGAIIGRYANRIAGASFTIDGTTYRLEPNDGRNSNHGGYSGFHQKLWQWEELPDGIRFFLTSPDGEGGYPGSLQVNVDYEWNEDNELSVRYAATTDRATYLNLTNHAYFNLSGTRQEITDHILTVPTRRMLDTTPGFIPTGEILDITGTLFDFTSGKPIGRDLYTNHPQIRSNKGYNHCYVLQDVISGDMQRAACLLHPQTQRQLIVETDLPAVLVYTAGYYRYPHTAVCLETQYFPDTPSHPHFPSCLLQPGEKYRHRTIYKFITSDADEM
jgi:aldose 1-epimerase